MIVGAVRQGTAQCPLFASDGQHGEVFAYVQSWRFGLDRFELPSNTIRSVRLHIETLVLRKATREEDKDTGLGPTECKAAG